MKTIKLTEEQKEQLLKPNMYMAAVFGEGIGWNLRIDNEDYFNYHDLEGPVPNGRNGYARIRELDEIENHPGFILISEKAMEITENSEDEIYANLDCDDCHGSGYFYVDYDPENQIFTTNLDVNLIRSDESSFKKTFEEWGNTQPQNQWQKFTYLKKLLDPEFIEKYKNEGDGGVFELIYNGGGDSGQFNEPVDIPQDIEYLGYEIIDVYHSGWENNEGADGTIVIDFNQRTISIYHLQYRESDKNVELEKYQLV